MHSIKSSGADLDNKKKDAAHLPRNIGLCVETLYQVE